VSIDGLLPRSTRQLSPDWAAGTSLVRRAEQGHMAWLCGVPQYSLAGARLQSAQARSGAHFRLGETKTDAGAERPTADEETRDDLPHRVPLCRH